jgi:arylsulfatase A-like enzyme
MSNMRICRREFLKKITVGLLALSMEDCLATRVKEAAAKKPNILYIMSDDHASNAVSCYKGVLSDVFMTPNIDRIAKEGIRLDNCFVTNSICTPSRAVILTGKYSHLNKTEINYIGFDGKQQTAPKLLQKNGYQTAIIGKWHLKGQPTGFDYWNILPGQGKYVNPEFLNMDLEPTNLKGYVTDIITDLSIDWIDKRDKTKPFFLMCHHKAPHESWRKKPDEDNLYDSTFFPEPQTFNDNYKNRYFAEKWTSTIYPFMTERMKDWTPESRALNTDGLNEQQAKEKTYQHYMRNYLQCIYTLDENIGRLLSHLEKESILDDTLIIYTSDNGMFIGEHGWYDKRLMYEESIRIPFVARYPKEIPSGTVSDAISLNLDFAETFLDYAQVEIPSDMQGQSLRYVLNGKTPANWRDSMLYAYYESREQYIEECKQYGIRTNRYKLICYPNGRELFDLQNDADELVNLYDDLNYLSIRNKLEDKLKKLLKKYKFTQRDMPFDWYRYNQDKIEESKDKKAYK